MRNYGVKATESVGARALGTERPASPAAAYAGR